jgi:glutathione S-transferase
MEQNFNEEHHKAAKSNVSVGYPDMGNGHYAQKISYRDWWDFNNAQRAHYNFVEQIASIVVFLAVGGAYYPIEAAAFGLVFFIARILYCWYRSEAGAANPLRRVGAGLGDVGLLGGVVLMFISSIKLINGDNLSGNGVGIAIGTNFGILVLTVGIMAFQCLLFGFSIAGRQRFKIFSKEFMQDNFGNIHRTEIHQDIRAGGYPDMGDGRYSKALNFQDWYQFMKGQRVHYNFVEQVAALITLLLCAGLYNPIGAIVCSGVIIVGRLLYAYFYLGELGALHPLRIVGAVSCNLASIAAFVLAIISGVKMINGDSA